MRRFNSNAADGPIADRTAARRRQYDAAAAGQIYEPAPSDAPVMGRHGSPHRPQLCSATL